MLNHSTTRRNQSTAEQQQTKQSTRNDQRAQPRHMIPLLIGLLLAASCIAAASSSTNINTYQSHHQAQAHFSMISQQQQQLQAGAPVITPFAFNDPVQENQRPSLTCTIVSGDSPVTISWLKDGQLLSQPQAQARKILILKPDLDTSMLKFNSVKLEHAGNYTCVAKNPLGQQSYSAQLIVRAEPRWLREPLLEPIVATRGQTIVIDCQTAGYPKPQQTWKIKSEYLIMAAMVAVSSWSCCSRAGQTNSVATPNGGQWHKLPLLSRRKVPFSTHLPAPLEHDLTAAATTTTRSNQRKATAAAAVASVCRGAGNCCRFK